MSDITVIRSLDNVRIKELAHLLAKKGRREKGRYLAEGIRIVSDALESGAEVKTLILLEENHEADPFSGLVRAADHRKVPILLVSREVMKKISSMDTPQGCVIDIKIPKTPSLTPSVFKSACVLAAGVQDPRNMGLLTRTVEAAGAGTLFVPAGSADPYHSSSVQTSMGAIFHRNPIVGGNPEDILAAARDAGVKIVATDVRCGVSIQTFAEKPPSDFLLLLGNEGAGLDPAIAESADVKITLPIFGRAESLNVAVSAGIILYYLKLNAKK